MASKKPNGADTPASRPKGGEPVDPDWHDESLILAMLELTPFERIQRGEEMARQAQAFRDAVGNQLQ